VVASGATEHSQAAMQLVQLLLMLLQGKSCLGA
jgi:hypothetical protein